MNLSRFDLATLRLFVAAVDEGSLTAGADRFGISVPAASKRIAELEQHCGIELLQRGQRGVTATIFGQTVHRHAIEVIARLEALAQSVLDFHSGASGHLKLFANPSAFGGFLPSVLAEYARQFPSISIDLEDALSEDGIRAVHAGEAELAVIGDNVPCDGLETAICNVDRLVLVVPAGHPLDRPGGVPLESVFDHDFVTLARVASLTRKVIAAAETVQRTPHIRVQVRSFDAMCRMVGSGIGIAILPSAAATLYTETLKLSVLELAGMETERTLLVAMRRRSELSPAAAALVDLMDQCVQRDSALRTSR